MARLQREPGSIREMSGGKVVTIAVDAVTRDLAKQLADGKPVSRWLRDTLREMSKGDQGKLIISTGAESPSFSSEKTPSKRSQIMATVLLMPGVMIDDPANVLQNMREAAVMIDRMEHDAVAAATQAVKDRFDELRQGSLEIKEENNA